MSETEELKKEIKRLERSIVLSLRNVLVLPNTMLQLAKERHLTPDESQSALKCIHGSVVMIEEKFRDFIIERKL